MVTVKEPTTLVGVSELRTKLEEILRVMEHSTVILERRRKPLAVLLPIAKYEELEATLEWVEDHVLGGAALARERHTPRRKYLSLDEVERRMKRR